MDSFADCFLNSRTTDYSSADCFSNSRTTDYSIPEKLLGLRLSITPSSVESIELALSRKADCSPASDGTKDDSDRDSKIPPAHMNASFIKIGTWKSIPKYEGDLVAKILYSRIKLVWEYLEDGLKRKIESKWCSIQGLNADIQPGKPGILRIELSEAPSLHAELQLRPKKHTNWVQSEDFTGGQARSCRIHYLRFAPGKLDKPYLDMLKCEPRLQALSRNCSPTLPNPCFSLRDDYNFTNFPYVDHNTGHLSVQHDLDLGSNLPIHYSNDPPQYVQPVQHRAVSSFNNMRGPTMSITDVSSSNNYALDSNNFHLGAYGNDQVMNQNTEISRIIPTEAIAMQSYQQTQNILNYYGLNNGVLEHYTNLLQTGTHSCSIPEQPPFERESPDSVLELEQRAFAANTPQMYYSLLYGNEVNWKSDFELNFAVNIAPPLPRAWDENLSEMQGNTEVESHQRLDEEDLDFKILDDDDIREIMALME